MSQPPPATRAHEAARKFVGLAAGCAIPSWMLSLVVHTGVIAGLATVTWSVRRPAEPEFSVGIAVKTESVRGPVFETASATFAPSKKSAATPADFVTTATPDVVKQSLPQLGESEMPTIGLAGSALGGGGMLTVPDGGEPGGFGVGGGAMSATSFFDQQAWGTKFVFVIDRSASMYTRDALGAAKRELVASLNQLPPEAQFQIIFYNQRTELMKSAAGGDRLLHASDANKQAARRFLDSIVADSGTDHLPALEAALRLGPDVIFFLTDADDMKASDVQQVTTTNKYRATIHAIEFGPGPDDGRPTTLRDLAAANGGSYRYVDTTRLGRAGGGEARRVQSEK